ncbi:hypothetical protein BN2476_210024 [Paraburkholderia piptadeniae]|uniref:Uncharacterized protein n=1 Tax=Paraburkholderia piptadeniae TaxID=1701573 RepID=A0A1N7RVE3_9BURK|nr:hypothetical protein BN2476_210024 [Paraburkholderia piptadeniae]
MSRRPLTCRKSPSCTRMESSGYRTVSARRMEGSTSGASGAKHPRFSSPVTCSWRPSSSASTVSTCRSRCEILSTRARPDEVRLSPLLGCRTNNCTEYVDSKSSIAPEMEDWEILDSLAAIAIDWCFAADSMYASCLRVNFIPPPRDSD